MSVKFINWNLRPSDPDYHARLLKPLKNKTPTYYWINPEIDLFNEYYGDDFVCSVFSVIAACPMHTFIVTTKHWEKANAWFTFVENETNRIYTLGGSYNYSIVLNHLSETISDNTNYDLRSIPWRQPWRSLDVDLSKDNKFCPKVDLFPDYLPRWPLSNVWFGITVSTQDQLNLGSSCLANIPARRKFYNIYPTESINIPLYLTCYNCHEKELGQYSTDMARFCIACGDRKWTIDWIIAGGKDQPLKPEWVRDIRDTCQSSKIPFYFTGWGKWCPSDQLEETVYNDLKAENIESLETAINWGLPIIVGEKRSGSKLDEVYHTAIPENK
jgi:hypothetical protein